MTDTTDHTRTLAEVISSLIGHPTPVDPRGRCWFCWGGLGESPYGHRSTCDWAALKRFELEAATDTTTDHERAIVDAARALVGEGDAQPQPSSEPGFFEFKPIEPFMVVPLEQWQALVRAVRGEPPA